MCEFCRLAETKEWVLSTEHFFAVYDRAPVTEGHILLISKKHYEDLSQLPQDHMNSLWVALHNTKVLLDAAYHPDGYNIGTNIGEAAGQTVMHFHMHVIPRRKGDVDNPRGGVRNLMKPLHELWPE